MLKSDSLLNIIKQEGEDNFLFVGFQNDFSMPNASNCFYIVKSAKNIF